MGSIYPETDERDAHANTTNVSTFAPDAEIAHWIVGKHPLTPDASGV
jgi:hypothetical protein